MFKNITCYISLSIIIITTLLSGCKNPLKKEEPYLPTTAIVNNHEIKIQRLNTPSLSTKNANKILDLRYQNGTYYLAMRSADNVSATVYAFQKEGTFLVEKNVFGKSSTATIKSRMILNVTIGADNTIYYMRNGVHAFKNNNEKVSLVGKTSASKFALLPGQKQAYLYGNDNFDIVSISKDGDMANQKPSFLKKRAAPFRGGLTVIDFDQDGILYGGGRAVPNGRSIVVSFDGNKQIRQYGTIDQLSKASIYNLIDISILKDYVCVIDGFNLKIWRKNGNYLGAINNSELLGNDLNALKITTIKDNSLLILGYLRNQKTKLVDIALFELTF